MSCGTSLCAPANPKNSDARGRRARVTAATLLLSVASEEGSLRGRDNDSLGLTGDGKGLEVKRKITPARARVLTALRDWKGEQAPSFRELAAVLSYSVSNVERHVNALHLMRLVNRIHGKGRTLTITPAGKTTLAYYETLQAQRARMGKAA